MLEIFTNIVADNLRRFDLSECEYGGGDFVNDLKEGFGVNLSLLNFSFPGGFLGD